MRICVWSGRNGPPARIDWRPLPVHRVSVSLANDLQKLIEQSCNTTWSQFDWVKAHAALYGLSRRTADKWTTPGEPAFVSMLVDSPVLRRRR